MGPGVNRYIGRFLEVSQISSNPSVDMPISQAYSRGMDVVYRKQSKPPKRGYTQGHPKKCLVK